MKWVLSFLNLITWCSKNGIQFRYSFTRGANIYKLRDKALLGRNDFVKGAPVLMNEPYDYILWIDSDQIFCGEHLGMLLHAKKDVISALIRTEDGTFSVSRLSGESKGEGVKRLTDEDMKDKIEPFEVDCLGFGFTLIKRGVYESIEFPWHKPVFVGDADYLSEDGSLINRLREKGWKFHVHPQCYVLHEKEMEI